MKKFCLLILLAFSMNSFSSEASPSEKHSQLCTRRLKLINDYGIVLQNKAVLSEFNGKIACIDSVDRVICNLLKKTGGALDKNPTSPDKIEVIKFCLRCVERKIDWISEQIEELQAHVPKK